jgi:hypothetical protein
MLIRPGVQVKSVESDANLPDRDLDQLRPYISRKYCLRHTEIGRRVAVSDEAGLDVRHQRLAPV